MCYCACYIIVILTIIYILFHERELFENDLPINYKNHPEKIYTSGATMRVLAQKFTSTNQGEPNIIYNALIPDKK